jgi:hypothetical protein
LIVTSGVCPGRASSQAFAFHKQASNASGVAFVTTLSAPKEGLRCVLSQPIETWG